MSQRKRDRNAIEQVTNIDINTEANNSSITPPTKKQRVNNHANIEKAGKRLIVWYQIAPFTKEQIDNILTHTEKGKNRPLILFADNEADNFCVRSKGKNKAPLPRTGNNLSDANSRLLSKYDNLKDDDNFLSVGIVTTFLNRQNCGTFTDFTRNIDENFKFVRTVIDRFHIRHLIVPAKYPSPSKQRGITHALSGAGLQLKHLRYIQQQIDEIEGTYAKTYYITEVPFFVGDGEKSYRSVIEKHRKRLLSSNKNGARSASDFDVNMTDPQNMITTPLQPLKAPTHTGKSGKSIPINCTRSDVVEKAPTVPTTPVMGEYAGEAEPTYETRYESHDVLPELPLSPVKRPASMIKPSPLLPSPIYDEDGDAQTIPSTPSTTRTELQNYVQYLSGLVQHQQMQLRLHQLQLWRLQTDDNCNPNIMPCDTPAPHSSAVVVARDDVNDNSESVYSSVRFVCFHVVSVMLLALIFYDPSSIFKLFWPSAYQNEEAKSRISFDVYLPLIILLYGLRQQTGSKTHDDVTTQTSEPERERRSSLSSWFHWLYQVLVAISKLFAIVAASYMMFALFADMSNSNVFGFDSDSDSIKGAMIQNTTTLMQDTFGGSNARDVAETVANDFVTFSESQTRVYDDVEEVPTYGVFKRLAGNVLLFYMTATLVWWLFGNFTKRAGIAWLTAVSLLSFVVYFGAYFMAMFIVGHHLEDGDEQMTKQQQLDILWNFIASKLMPLFISFGIVIPSVINWASSSSLRAIINWRSIGYTIGSALVIYCMRYYPIYTFYAFLLFGFLYMGLQCSAHCIDRKDHKNYVNTSTIQADMFGETPTPFAPFTAGTNPWYD
mmetsp:Transcript_39229/g.64200  ORF Transcript_39229/g.64200 Transcript_39229/m.64200 type:complete len:832 (-) Transcript_39229:164-2659(-)